MRRWKKRRDSVPRGRRQLKSSAKQPKQLDELFYDTLDAGLLAAAQAVEHYEISRYGTLKSWAHELGLTEAVRLLDQTLQEKRTTDETLTGIAETVVNQEADAA